jgi:transcriptional regulator with XRE-family HTH domain
MLLTFQSVYHILHTIHCIENINMDKNFGDYIRELREAKQKENSSFSLRQTAARMDVEPSYLSKVERGIEKNPSEQFVKKLAVELEQDENMMLAMVGKVSQELKDIILKKPQLFSELLKSLKDSPDNAILRIVREVKDGIW